MTKSDIAYNFHDSTIVSVSIGPEREVTFVIELYPIAYPDKPQVILRFSGIFNYEVVEAYIRQIKVEGDEDYIGCRIDGLQYDTKKQSTDKDKWFFLETDWCGPLPIHCAEMTIEVKK